MSFPTASVKANQRVLSRMNLYTGKIDGIAGPLYSRALHDFATQTLESAKSNLGRVTPNPATLSPAAENLILEFEVGGGEEYYNKKLYKPTYPGGDSGVTIGCGYDLGYIEKAEFDRDWSQLAEPTKARLRAVIGFKGYSALMRVGDLSDIHILWGMAVMVFRTVTVPKWLKITREAFPGCEFLPPDAEGALVSLCFNRGPSMSNDDRRREMREIRSLVPSGDLDGIADAIRRMKRLWVGTSIEGGMRRRREAEAVLVESAA